MSHHYKEQRDLKRVRVAPDSAGPVARESGDSRTILSPLGSSEVSNECVWLPTPPCVPGAHEHDDSSADRSLSKELRGLKWFVCSPTPPCLPRDHDSGDTSADRSLPGSCE
eukprot:195652-Pyramimonas_sp.AAC.1